MENFPPPVKLAPLGRKRPGRSKRLGRPAPSRGLRADRERNGVSLEAIARNTRIPRRHLEELERGDVSQWPAGVYARSWAREYAMEAGLDPERVIAIVAPVAEVEESVDAIKEAREQSERLAARVSFWPVEPMIALMRRFAAIALVLTLLGLVALYFFKSGTPSRAPAEQPVGTSGVSPGQPPR
jgi:cytoskeletal protein RodZ